MAERRRKRIVNGQTEGVSPKVPVQAIAAVLVWVAAYFGVDLSAEVSAALAVLIGAASGYWASPGTVKET